jgi:hypothetical protein
MSILQNSVFIYNWNQNVAYQIPFTTNKTQTNKGKIKQEA